MPEQTGTLQDPALVEVSGVVASRRQKDVFWVHNDSGDQARIFAINLAGEHLGEFRLEGVTATDWEDIALVPQADADADAIVIADIGDNAAQRDTVTLIHLDEPALPDDPAVPVTITDAAQVEHTYLDHSHDAESIFFDLVSNNVAIITKEYTDTARLYRPGASAGNAPITLAGGTEVALGPGQLATGADAAADGTAILVRSYSDVLVFAREVGESAEDALARTPCTAPAATEQQGEAIAVLPDGSGFVTISEGAGAPIWKVSAS